VDVAELSATLASFQLILTNREDSARAAGRYEELMTLRGIESRILALELLSDCASQAIGDESSWVRRYLESTVGPRMFELLLGDTDTNEEPQAITTIEHVYHVFRGYLNQAFDRPEINRTVAEWNLSRLQSELG
jgi:hypothetical protein